VVDDNLKKDPNFVTTIGVIDNTSAKDVVNLVADSITKRLLVDDSNSRATTVTIYNIGLTAEDTEYSQALPDSTKAITFQCRTDYDIRFAFVTGKVATLTAPYMTLKMGQNYFEDNLNLTSKTLYLACATAAQIVEIICFS